MDPAQVKAEVDSAFARISRYLEWTATDVEASSVGLVVAVRSAVQARRQRFEAARRLEAVLGIPIERRRGHGALYDAVNADRIEIGRLRRSLAGLPLPRAADGRLVLAVDVSSWLPDHASQPMLRHQRGLVCTSRRREGRRGQPILSSLVTCRANSCMAQAISMSYQVTEWSASKVRSRTSTRFQTFVQSG